MDLTNSKMSELYDASAEELLRFFYRRTLEPQDALDLVGETFAQALKSRRRFKGDSLDEARAWLFGIAHNLLKGYYRSARVSRETMERLQFERVELQPDEVQKLEEIDDAREQRERIAGAIDRLKAEYREAIQLRVLDQLEYDEVARRLGVSEEVVRARVSRGIKRLRKLLDDDSVGGGSDA